MDFVGVYFASCAFRIMYRIVPVLFTWLIHHNCKTQNKPLVWNIPYASCAFVVPWVQWLDLLDVIVPFMGTRFALLSQVTTKAAFYLRSLQESGNVVNVVTLNHSSAHPCQVVQRLFSHLKWVYTNLILVSFCVKFWHRLFTTVKNFSIILNTTEIFWIRFVFRQIYRT